MLSRVWTVAGLCSMLFAGLVTFAAAQPPKSDPQPNLNDYPPEMQRVIQGYKIAPVPLDKRHLDPALVGLGSYLVNAVGGCNDCHTNPPYADGGNPYLGEPKQINTDGYLAGGMAFGPFVSRNITPAANGYPAGLTFQQFRIVLRTGHDFDNLHPQMGPLLQVMPWPIYGNMTNHDLRAIYEYLRAIPSIDTGGDD